MLTTSKLLTALYWSWYDNLNWTNTWTRQKRQTTSYKDDKQSNVALRRRNH